MFLFICISSIIELEVMKNYLSNLSHSLKKEADNTWELVLELFQVATSDAILLKTVSFGTNAYDSR